MTIGSLTDVINARKVELIVDPDGTPNDFFLLQEISIPLARPETREAVAGGAVYFYGQHDNAFDATFLLSSLDVATFLNFNRITNGHLNKVEYGIRLTSKSGNITTIRVTAVAPEQEIEKLPEGGLKIYQTFRITEDVDASNVTET